MSPFWKKWVVFILWSWRQLVILKCCYKNPVNELHHRTWKWAVPFTSHLLYCWPSDSVFLAVVLVMLHSSANAFWVPSLFEVFGFLGPMCWDNSLVPTSSAKQSKPSPYFMLVMQCCSEGLLCSPASHHPKCTVASMEEVGSTYYTCVETRDMLPIYFSYGPYCR